MRPNLQQEVANRLRQDIFAGRLRPGSRIDQGALAESLGVSRLPVREALIALEGEGLIDTVPRHGAFVWSFGPDDLRDQYELFGLVLGKATERAADRLSEDELDELRAVVAKMRTTAEPGRLARLNDQFHATINRASGSRRLAWLVRLLEGSVPPGFEAGGWQLAAQHHAQILERLAARDREGAGRAMRDHISAAGEHALRVLTESGFWGD